MNINMKFSTPRKDTGGDVIKRKAQALSKSKKDLELESAVKADIEKETASLKEHHSKDPDLTSLKDLASKAYEKYAKERGLENFEHWQYSEKRVEEALDKPSLNKRMLDGQNYEDAKRSMDKNKEDLIKAKAAL